ncbi:MAG: insulinase family protein [Flavobacteriaceae bacterium]|nr:insulinase family protein [Flavobacteriaceae bacterium]
MITKKQLLYYCLLLFTIVSFSQNFDLEKTEPLTQNETSKIPVDPNVKIGKLSNGLTYYIRNNGKPANKVELRLVVNAGSILENDNQVGLAHFMEHMNFNGTKNFKKNELVDYLQSIGVKFGADLNAYTSFDQTVYILPIPSDDPEKLEKGFQIIEDWAHNATLADEAIDDERGVVLEEYRLGLGPNKRMMQQYLPKLMYGSKYAERLPIGTKENLENFKYEDVRSYYRDWYRPDLMAVVAVGDLDIDKLEAKIKEHFGSIAKANNPKERNSFDLPSHEETFVTVATDKEAAFSQVQIMYKDNFKAPKIETIEDYRETIVRNLFSSMINNRLSELTNKPNPPFVYGFSSYGGTFSRSKNAYQSFAGTSETGQLAALKALLEENERVKRYGFQEGEFTRAKKNILARLEKQYKDRNKQESNRIIGEYVSNYLNGEPIPGIEWEFNTTKKYIGTIQLSEVNTLINSFIHDDNRVIILTGPEKEGLTSVTETEILELLKTVQTSNIEPYMDEAVRKDLIENILLEGTITNIEKNDSIDATTFTLSNGATVTYKKTDFKNDEILFEATSFGGTSLYTDEEHLATTFANGGLTEAGIGGLSKVDLKKMMSGKIVNVRPFIQLISEGFSGQSAPKDLETLFQQVYLYFTDLNKDQEAFQSFITKQKSFLGNLMANPQFYFSNETGKFRNKGNKRFTGFPTPEKMDKADYDLAYNKYQERFADAGDFNFYFVGNIDEEQLKVFAKKYIASLPTINSNETFKVTTFREKDTYRKQVVNRGKDPKSLVSINWGEDDIEYSAKKKQEVIALGDILTIKLIEKLREEESGVYGVGARGSFRKLSFTGVDFTISFPCGPENVDRLIAAALAEVEKIKKEGPSDKDLAKVKETYLLKYKEDLKKNRFWLSNFITSDKESSDVNEILNAESSINALTKKDIQNVANEFLDENYFLGILLPEED